MTKLLSGLLLIHLFITPSAALSADNIPNATLRVTVQQKEEGRIGKGFHVLELSCWDGNCSLSSVSLNQCMESEQAVSGSDQGNYLICWMNSR